MKMFYGKSLNIETPAVNISKNLEINRSIASVFDDMLAKLDKSIGLIRKISNK